MLHFCLLLPCQALSNQDRESFGGGEDELSCTPGGLSPLGHQASRMGERSFGAAQQGAWWPQRGVLQSW